MRRYTLAGITYRICVCAFFVCVSLSLFVSFAQAILFSLTIHSEKGISYMCCCVVCSTIHTTTTRPNDILIHAHLYHLVLQFYILACIIYTRQQEYSVQCTCTTSTFAPLLCATVMVILCVLLLLFKAFWEKNIKFAMYVTSDIFPLVSCPLFFSFTTATCNKILFFFYTFFF